VRVRESAVPDVRPMCERFIGDRRGELGKLTAGHQDYYEREVASGAEDYYAMRERPGSGPVAAPRCWDWTAARAALNCAIWAAAIIWRSARRSRSRSSCSSARR